MEIFKKVSQQTLWQILGKGISSLSTLLILGIMTRTYGEEGTGIFTLSLTLIAFLTMAVDLGLNPHLLPRFLKENFSLEWQKLLGLRLILATFLIFFGGLIILIWPVQRDLFKIVSLLGLAAIMEMAVFTTANIIFQAKLRFDLSISGVLGMVPTLLVVFLAAQIFLPLPYIMTGYILGWVISGLLALVFVKKYITSLLPIFDFNYIKKVFQNVWPISATLVLNIIYFRLDAFILSSHKGFADVGIYNVAYQMFQTALVFPTFIMNSFYPLMIKNYQKDFNKFRSNLSKTLLLMLVLSFLGTLLTIILSPLLITLLTNGKGFIGSITVLRILALSFPAFFLTSVLMWTLITINKYKIMLVIYLIGLIFNFAANLIFIPQYSYIGASWVTVASEYLILSLQIIILKRILFKGQDGN